MGTRVTTQQPRKEKAVLSYFVEPSMQVSGFKTISLGTQKAKGLLTHPFVGDMAGKEDPGAQFQMRGISRLARTYAQLRKGQNE